MRRPNSHKKPARRDPLYEKKDADRTLGPRNGFVWRDKLVTVTEEEKRRFDAIFSLFDVAWRQFNLRRDFEFKVTLSLWTALALAIAGLAKASELQTIPMLGMIPICVAVFVLHTLWCWGIGQAQNGERRIAFGYERTLQKLSQTCFDEITKKQLASLQERMGLLKNWTYVFQLGVTALLLVALLAVSAFHKR